MPFPFEVGFDDLQADLDTYVDAVFGCLESGVSRHAQGQGLHRVSGLREWVRDPEARHRGLPQCHPGRCYARGVRHTHRTHRAALHARLHAARVGLLRLSAHRRRGDTGGRPIDRPQYSNGPRRGVAEKGNRDRTAHPCAHRRRLSHSGFEVFRTIPPRPFTGSTRPIPGRAS